MRIFRLLWLLAAAAFVAAGARGADEEPPELAQMRAAYLKDVEFATRPMRDRYLSKLDVLKRALGGRGDVRAAVAVQEEIDRLKGEIGDFARFAGSWTIAFVGGRSRHYVIRSDGQVVWDEENGQKMPAKIGHLNLQGAQATLRLTDAEVERLTLADKKLTVEHFFPAATYPGGTPELRGVGSR